MSYPPYHTPHGLSITKNVPRSHGEFTAPRSEIECDPVLEPMHTLQPPIHAHGAPSSTSSAPSTSSTSAETSSSSSSHPTAALHDSSSSTHTSHYDHGKQLSKKHRVKRYGNLTHKDDFHVPPHRKSLTQVVPERFPKTESGHAHHEHEKGGEGETEDEHRTEGESSEYEEETSEHEQEEEGASQSTGEEQASDSSSLIDKATAAISSVSSSIVHLAIQSSPERPQESSTSASTAEKPSSSS